MPRPFHSSPKEREREEREREREGGRGEGEGERGREREGEDGRGKDTHTQPALMNFHKRQVLCFGDRAGTAPVSREHQVSSLGGHTYTLTYTYTNTYMHS